VIDQLPGMVQVPRRCPNQLSGMVQVPHRCLNQLSEEAQKLASFWFSASWGGSWTLSAYASLSHRDDNTVRGPCLLTQPVSHIKYKGMSKPRTPGPKPSTLTTEPSFHPWPGWVTLKSAWPPPPRWHTGNSLTYLSCLGNIAELADIVMQTGTIICVPSSLVTVKFFVNRLKPILASLSLCWVSAWESEMDSLLQLNKRLEIGIDFHFD